MLSVDISSHSLLRVEPGVIYRNSAIVSLIKESLRQKFGKPARHGVVILGNDLEVVLDPMASLG